MARVARPHPLNHTTNHEGHPVTKNPTIPDGAILAALNAETRRDRTRLDAYPPDHVAEARAAVAALLAWLGEHPEDLARLIPSPAQGAHGTRIAQAVEDLAASLEAEADEQANVTGDPASSFPEWTLAGRIRTALEDATT